MDVDHVEELGERVLASVPPYIWDGATLPVPVEAIADSFFGLLVVEADDPGCAPGAPPVEAGQTLSGLLLADRREIWVNSTEATQWPGRRRFTIGHELGHWCLHRDGGHHSVFCRSTTVIDEARPALPIEEQEANAFAAALLMPPRLLRAQYKATGGNFHELCAKFGSSMSAMGKRLHQVV